MQNCRLLLEHENTSYQTLTSLWPVLIAVENLLRAAHVLPVNEPLKIPGFDDVTLQIQME
jgi:hypothetical protein